MQGRWARLPVGTLSFSSGLRGAVAEFQTSAPPPRPPPQRCSRCQAWRLRIGSDCKERSRSQGQAPGAGRPKGNNEITWKADTGRDGVSLQRPSASCSSWGLARPSAETTLTMRRRPPRRFWDGRQPIRLPLPGRPHPPIRPRARRRLPKRPRRRPLPRERPRQRRRLPRLR